MGLSTFYLSFGIFAGHLSLPSNTQAMRLHERI